MLSNISITANNLTGNVDQTGVFYKMGNLQSGYFTLHGKRLNDRINANMFRITQFRYYCYKPSVGRIIHVVSNPDTSCGQKFVGVAIGELPKGTQCHENVFKRLFDDTSFVSTDHTSLLFGADLVNRYYFAPFFKYYLYHFTFGYNDRYECDDSPTNPTKIGT